MRNVIARAMVPALLALLVPGVTLANGDHLPDAYRWVAPPEDLVHGNVEARGVTATLGFGDEGLRAGSAVTPDGQASVIFPPGGITARAGEKEISVSIEPLDPATLGAPPSGFAYDGNAYRVEVVYAASRAPAPIPVTTCPSGPDGVAKPSLCATIVLRYAFGATEIYGREGDAWVRLESTGSTASMNIYGETIKFGVFVAAQPEEVAGQETGGKSPLGFVLGIGALVAALGITAARAKRRSRHAAR